MKRYLKHRIDLYRRYGYWKNASCIYIHIPRAAGTSINKAIYGRTLGHYHAAEIKTAFPRLFERAFVFSFVRNPWDRVLSAYRFAKKGRTESMGMYRPKQYQVPEFDSFERFLFEWLSVRDIFRTDFVFQPQYPFVLDVRGEMMVDFIGHVENMAADWAVIEDRLGRSLSITHSNRTGDVGSYRNAFISQEMVDRVADIFRQDIESFGYQF